MNKNIITVDIGNIPTSCVDEFINRLKNKSFKTVTAIDIGNIPTQQVEKYMNSVLTKCKSLTPKTKWQRFKLWVYDKLDTLGIAGSFGL